MGDFTGFDFAVGSVFGQRVWKADKDGNLRGIVHDLPPWTPDVNDARCDLLGSFWFKRIATGYVQIDLPGEFSPSNGDHIAGCFCGFYGYYANQRNTYADSMWMIGECPVSGVVEAYGKTVLGTKGFRASKARIVALCLPPYRDPVADIKASWLVRRIERTHDWDRSSYGTDAYDIAGWVTCALSLAASGFVVMLPWLAPLLAALFVAGAYTVWSSFKAIDYHYDLLIARKFGPRDWTERYEKVRARYPDIPVYDTVEAMLAAHPVTPPPDVNG